jgi:glyoxylase-like metal-dependent hydrolase (beta-lactamase superfamily II)
MRPPERPADELRLEPPDRAPGTLPAYARDLGHGIVAVDTGFHREGFDAAYLMLHEGRAAFVDTGTNLAVPRLLATLHALGVAPDAVDWVIPTHVHLDHAGGAGALMRELPAARLVVHPRGARHLVDPSLLYQGALAIYGQAEMDRSYGTLVPVDAARVLTTTDGMTLALAGRPLLFADTPGHARHHHCIWDAASRGWFTGDTFGLSYREFDTEHGPWMLPTTTPVQFDPAPLRASIERLLSFAPERIYLTHFGAVAEPAALGAQLLALIERMVAIGERERGAPQRHARLKDALGALYLDSLRAHGCTMDETAIAALLALDIELNAQGMACWLDRDNTR